ncbi:hypothetical protein [Thalassomonas sp. RHCl1]|uniref:hypothetical protein n=1 Tax=Thalassomonas sp. RHCl1 TaxID=2995320 RepID=UPI00248C9BEA|nr:hypothetical protein [Thalassomonas sp. RHCl1]
MRLIYIFVLLTSSLSVFASNEKEVYVEFMNKCFYHGKSICEKNILGESKLKKQFLAYSEFIFLSKKLNKILEEQYSRDFVKELSRNLAFNPSKPDGSDLKFERVNQNEIRGKFNGVDDVYLVRKGDNWLLDASKSNLLNYINFEGEETDILYFFVGLYKSILNRIVNEKPNRKSIVLQRSVAIASYFPDNFPDLKQVKEIAGMSGFTLEQIKNNYIEHGR